MSIEILIKGRFRELPGATSRKIASNAWEVTVPIDDATKKLLKGNVEKGLDGAILVIDDKECEPAVVSRLDKTEAVLSVWVL